MSLTQFYYYHQCVKSTTLHNVTLCRMCLRSSIDCKRSWSMSSHGSYSASGKRLISMKQSKLVSAGTSSYHSTHCIFIAIYLLTELTSLVILTFQVPSFLNLKRCKWIWDLRQPISHGQWPSTECRFKNQAVLRFGICLTITLHDWRRNRLSSKAWHGTISVIHCSAFVKFNFDKMDMNFCLQLQYDKMIIPQPKSSMDIWQWKAHKMKVVSWLSQELITVRRKLHAFVFSEKFRLPTAYQVHR